jgi:ATP-dependent Clp protease ATP-binding subunit ClpX
MDDQQQPDNATATRPKPAGRIEVPVSEVDRFLDHQAYPRMVRTDPIPIDMPRSQILHAIHDAVAAGLAEAEHLRVDASALAVFAERVCASADEDSRLRSAVWSFIQRMTDGVGLLRHSDRREAIHQRMCAVFGDIPDRADRTTLPTADEIAERDRLILSLRGSACALPQTAVRILTECHVTPNAATALSGLADAERELAERLDDDPQITDAMRRSWAKDISRAVAARDLDIRRARWSLEHRIEAARPDSPTAYAWAALERHASETSKRDGPHGTPDDRLRVLMAWIVAAGGRTTYSEMLVHLWRPFPLRRASVKSLLDTAYAVQRMRPLAERALRPDIEDQRRDWRAWHPGSRIAIASMIALVGEPDPCRESTFVAPRWLRRLARDDFTADGSVVADHLAHTVEGRGAWKNVVVSEIRNGMPRLLVGGPTRPFNCSDPEDDVVDERPSLDMTGGSDDGDEGGPAMVHRSVPAEPARSAAPIQPAPLSAPSTAAEAAAARSPNRVIREAHAIASHLRRIVIGQEEAIRVISVAIAESRAGRKQRGAILISGPSGCGKTHLVQTAANLPDIRMPFFAANAAAMVPAGIRGTNVDDLALGLVRATDGDVAKAERGLLFLDEADKLATTSSESADKYGPTVLAQVLRFLDGEEHTVADAQDKYVVAPGQPKHTRFGTGSKFKTKDLVIVLAGAWSHQRDDAKAEAGNAVGFAVGGARGNADPGRLSLDDLAGLPRELRGRVSRYCAMREPDAPMLGEILSNCGASWIGDDDTWRRVTAAARTHIARLAIERGTGARGLQSIVVALRDHLVWHPDAAASTAPIGPDLVDAALATYA